MDDDEFDLLMQKIDLGLAEASSAADAPFYRALLDSDSSSRAGSVSAEARPGSPTPSADPGPPPRPALSAVQERLVRGALCGLVERFNALMDGGGRVNSHCRTFEVERRALGALLQKHARARWAQALARGIASKNF